MSRREELESIILGTLLNSFGTTEFYDECKDVITEETFTTPLYGEIYKLVRAAFESGMDEVNPLSVCQMHGWDLPVEIIMTMVELSRAWDFTTKMAEYNDKVFHTDTRLHKKYSRAKFSDYVSRLFSIS